MLPVPDASLPAVEICSHLIANGRVVVHDVADGIDELDDQLRDPIARRRLAAEDERARHHLRVGIRSQTVIERDHVQDVQVLTLVFVDTLDLNVEERRRIDEDPGLLLHEARKLAFVRLFDVAPTRTELAIVDQRIQSFELI
jgi:hypothetical protein